VRVVLINQYYPPSEAPTGLLLADLGESLAMGGHDVTVICSRRDYTDPERRFALRERVRGVEVRRARGTGFGRGSRIGRLLDYLSFLVGAALRLALQRRPEVVVTLTTPPMLALPALSLARLKRARFVFWVMDVYPDLAFELGVLRRGSVVGRLFERLSRHVLRGSDAVAALGEPMAEVLRAAGARRVEIVHNWADGEAIVPLSVEENPLRRECGWQDRFVVLYSGNLGLAHEFETVLCAAERLRDRPDVLFAFVGTGPSLERLRQECRRRGLTNVEFRPWVPHRELGRSLTSGDIHLITLREGLAGLLVPSKIYGTLAAGRPTVFVGPANSEITAILREGECGVHVSPGEDGALAEAIAAYAVDEPRRLEHGRRARLLFERRYSGERALRQLTALIEADGD